MYLAKSKEEGSKETKVKDEDFIPHSKRISSLGDAYHNDHE